MKKIAVLIGNYKSNNAGDDFYKYLLSERYKDIKFYHSSDCDILKSDFVIFGGGGLLNPDNTGRINILEKADAIGLPIIGISLGSVGSTKKVDPTQSHQIISKFKFVTVRDEYSYKTLRKINKNTTNTGDLVWCYNPSIIKKRNEFFNIGIMLRHCTKFKDTDLINKTILYLRKCESYLLSINRKMNLIFFNTYGEKLSSRTLEKEIIRHFNNFEHVVHHKTDDMIEHLDNYNRCDFVFAMPYHGVLLSILYDVPCTGFIYESKLEDLDKLFQLNMSWDLSEIGLEKMFETFKDSIDNESFYDKKVIEELKNSSFKTFKKIDKFLKVSFN
jgi:polysaccharide pyruvyl transferase WcaK-like protein